VNGSHVGICWSEALASGGGAAERLPCGIKYTAAPAPAPAPQPRPNYNNALWPSPRPKLFAKACEPDLKTMKHQDALAFLAKRAGITVDELLKMHPTKYATEYMTAPPPYWHQTMMMSWR